MFKSTRRLFFTRYISPPKERLISIFSTLLHLQSQSVYNTVEEKTVTKKQLEDNENQYTIKSKCIEQMKIVRCHKNEILRDWLTKEDLDRDRRREEINHTIERENNT